MFQSLSHSTPFCCGFHLDIDQQGGILRRPVEGLHLLQHPVDILPVHPKAVDVLLLRGWRNRGNGRRRRRSAFLLFVLRSLFSSCSCLFIGRGSRGSCRARVNTAVREALQCRLHKLIADGGGGGGIASGLQSRVCVKREDTV